MIELRGPAKKAAPSLNPPNLEGCAPTLHHHLQVCSIGGFLPTKSRAFEAPHGLLETIALAGSKG